jgi:hypothetical protein
LADAGGKETARSRALSQAELTALFEAMRNTKGFTQVNFNGLPIEGKNNRYEKITLRFKTGKVNLAGYGTIIFHEDGVIRLHYPVKKTATVNSSDGVIGVDKGYTEAQYGSDKVVYGAGIGKIISQQADWLKAKMQNRHKLHTLYKKTGNENIRKIIWGVRRLISEPTPPKRN